MGINHALRRARQKRGWSQAILAAKIDTSPKNVSRWECGSTFPSPYFRTRLCQLFEVDASALGFLEQKKESPTAVKSGAASPLLDTEIPRQAIASGQFIGRVELVEQLLGLLESEASCTLYGLPGVGKTTLAHVVSLHTRTREVFADGTLWIRLGPNPDVQNELLRLAHLLEVSADHLSRAYTVERLSQLVQQTLRERRVFIVIDDAWSLEAVLPLLVGGAHAFHLITTRLPAVAFGLPMAHSLAVPELDTEQSRALLTMLVPSLVDHSTMTVQHLLRSTGGLPLTLTLLGHYLRTQAIGGQRRRLDAALQQLIDGPQRLHIGELAETTFHAPNTSSYVFWSLEKIIDISNSHLSSEAQQALYALAVLPAKPDRFSEAAALAVSRQEVEVFDQLLDAGLLEGAGEGWYFLHQTIADYARTRLDNAVVGARLVQYALLCCQDQHDVERLLDEHATLLAALHVQVDDEREREQVLLVHLLARFWRIQGRFLLAQQELGRVLTAARERDDRASIAQILSDLAQIALPLGDEQEAQRFLDEAETLAREQGLPALLYEILNNFGALHYARGNLKASEQAYQETLALAQRLEEAALKSQALNNLGMIAVTRGQTEEGIRYWQAQLEQDRKQQNWVGICHVLANMGRVFAHRLDSQERASEAFQEALVLAERLDFQGERSDIRYWLAELARRQGRCEQAEKFIQEGLQIAHQGGQRREIILLLEQAAYLAYERGDVQTMERTLVEAQKRADELQNPFIAGLIQRCWGHLHLARKHFEAATASFELARQTFEDQEEEEFLAWAEYGLAQALDARGKVEEARQWAEKSLAWFTMAQHVEMPAVQAWLEKSTQSGDIDV